MELALLEIAAAVLHEFNLVGWAFPLGISLELLFPRGAVSSASRLKGAALWTTYILTAGTIAAGETHVAQWLGLKPLLSLGPGAPWFVGVGAAILAAFVADFFYYWCHRLQHTPLLWRFHAVHHSIRDMNALNSVHHWTEEPIHFLLLYLPTSVIFSVAGPAQQALATLIVLQTVYIHTPCTLSLGPLRSVLVDNRFHRIHHSVEPQHRDHNFGVFTTLWDQLFGTAYFPADEWPDVGLDDQPETAGVLDYLVRPFTYPRTVG